MSPKMSDKPMELNNQMVELMKQVYTETVVDNAMNPRNAGRIQNPDGLGSATSSCGETMEIRLQVKRGNVEDATFWTNGCSATVACGSIATELIKGKDVTRALSIDQDDILKALGGLQEGNHHCAQLIANAVKAAALDYLAIKKEPWKKAYRQC
jgi:nitrogen fixation NifU-like protein